MFEDENGRIIDQMVDYEWKPVLRSKCKNFGHEVTQCRKQQTEEALKKPVEDEGNKKEPSPPAQQAGDRQKEMLNERPRQGCPSKAKEKEPETRTISSNRYSKLLENTMGEAENVADMGNKDLRSAGSFYTWSNKQQGVARVYSKIDRVLVNDEWVSNLPASKACFLQEGLYDHCPVLVHWEKHNMSRTRQFRYFNMWSLAPDFLRKIKSSWDERIVGRRMFQVVGKLNRLKSVLKQLNWDRFSDIENKVTVAMEQLLNCQVRIQQSQSTELFDEEMQLAKQCEQLQNTKHQYLNQKCKAKWLQEGDQNTALFHRYLKARRNKN
ncbi:hypothetical protein P3L10_019646 [Capsicum annuum]